MGSQEFVHIGLIALVLMGSDLACFVPTRTCARDPGEQENRDGAMAGALV